MSQAAHALLVAALPSEARSLIDHWRLKRDNRSHAFPVYHNTHPKADRTQPVSLIVSGIGKQNAAAACAHLFNYCAPSNAVWLNVGIAGHASLERGTPLIAHACKDETTGKSHYPPILFDSLFESHNLTTVERMVSGYPTNSAIDMEASAFFNIATKYTSGELVHSIKIISDNSQQGPEKITAENATQWIECTVESIQHTLDQLIEIAGLLPNSEVTLPAPFRKLHFSVSQQKQLDTLIRRWHAIAEGRPLPSETFENIESSREAIRMLSKLLDTQTVHYQ